MSNKKDSAGRQTGIDIEINKENSGGVYQGREYGEVDLPSQDIPSETPPPISGHPDSGGMDHENTHIAPPSFKGMKTALIVLIALIAAVLTWEVYIVISEALLTSWVLAVLYLSVVVLMLGMGMRLLFSFLYDKRNLSEMLAIKERASEITKNYNMRRKDSRKAKTEKAQILIRELKEFFSAKPQKKQFDLCIQSLPDYSDDGEVVRHIDNVFLKPLDREAMKRVSSHCLQTGTVVALSPWAAIDMLFALWRNTRMIDEIGELYGFRPSMANRYRLLKNLVAHLAYLGASEILTSTLTEEFLAQSIIGKASARIGQGVGASIFTARIGLLAMSLTRPIEFDPEEQPTAGMMVEPIVDSLVDIVKSKQPDSPEPETDTTG
jgi:putative membrane protein